MRIDRLLRDLIEWLDLLVRNNFKPKKGRKLLYERIRSIQPADSQGMLYQVEGRNTPRAIATWIYAPSRIVKPLDDEDDILDWHIMLDECRLLTKEERQQMHSQDSPKAYGRQPQYPPRYTVQLNSARGKLFTHTITIIRASHFLYEDSTMEFEFVATQDLDFRQISNQKALLATWLVALLVARRGEHIPNITWPEEIQEVRDIVLGEPSKNPRTQAAKLFRGRKIPRMPLNN